jgi:hypothetical protein
MDIQKNTDIVVAAGLKTVVDIAVVDIGTVVDKGVQTAFETLVAMLVAMLVDNVDFGNIDDHIVVNCVHFALAISVVAFHRVDA